jgi:uncharacterized protein (TIGR02145 family)
MDGTTRLHYGNSKPQFCDKRDGNKYVYVTIGTQIWMAENLNYDAIDSKCNNNNETNCNIYGRLYDWATSMNLEASCNTSSCMNQVQPKHQGICPAGWHLPSNAEWLQLTNFVGINPGTKLKANVLWSGVGFDKHGFSALPGGNHFNSPGSSGVWWNSTESESYNNLANYLNITGSETKASLSAHTTKTSQYSVRCLHDDSYSSVPSSSSSSTPLTQCPVYDSSTHFCDSRDFKIYRYTKIGTQTWMAENLNYHSKNRESMCHDNDPDYCDYYGRRYAWAAAMDFASICNTTYCASDIRANHQGLCPSGWHIPSDAEWTQLINFVGGASNAGTKLKATNGWNAHSTSTYGNGTDDYDFSALPGGGFNTAPGSSSIWWSSADIVGDGNSYPGTYYREMFYNSSGVSRSLMDKFRGLHYVRCVKN